jgi:hypothetical protein
MSERYEEIPKLIKLIDNSIKMDYGYKVALLKSIMAYYEGMQAAEAMQTLLVKTLAKVI